MVCPALVRFTWSLLTSTFLFVSHSQSVCNMSRLCLVLLLLFYLVPPHFGILDCLNLEVGLLPLPSSGKIAVPCLPVQSKILFPIVSGSD